MKKILKRFVLILLTLISISVIYTYGYRAVFTILSNRAVAGESQIDFAGTGRGISWINESASQTLFFIPSSQESAVEELYGSWLRELHTAQGVNIIVPPFNGAVNSPSLDNQSVNPQSRSNQILYSFNLYSGMVGKKHDITVMSTGDGSLQALALAASGAAVDKYMLLSPVHGDRTNRGTGFFQKIASLPFLYYLLPWLPDSFGKNRIGPYDILNDELSESFSQREGVFYPRYINNRSLSAIDRAAGKSMEDIDKIDPNRFFIIYGDDDLSYSLEGFERMGDALKSGGSEVTIMRISSSGRMLLFDNGKGRILDLISILLQ
ncbi:hypothetical protein [Spirochaeta isovalerica]|uniref:Alpha/beta hydrolase n=1 Tax=Spirochaeta isovalerica TaxID=150 RepID=A0A841R6P7_9SPIO|nr:hypothetical protein [Spirochaeta isovalerica]MBB6478448.1 hypothetical protein [Spirochaeta isovalerica]